jgi:hypothetical protein
MQLIAVTLAAGCLVVIAWQDFVARRVWGVCFGLLAAAGVLYMAAGVESPRRLLVYAGCNLGFLIVQFGLLKVYFLVRRRGGAVIDRMIGWGDILFLLATVFFFSPVNFISFYVYSLLISLLVSLIWMAFRPSVSKAIPLAGLQSLVLLVVIGAGSFLHFPLVGDDWFIHKFLPS